MERKKIVILDGFAANPGDLSWGEIEAMGDCSVYVRCDSEQEIVERASEAEIILTNKSVISRRVMEQLPKLNAGFWSAMCRHTVRTPWRSLRLR